MHCSNCISHPMPETILWNQWNAETVKKKKGTLMLWTPTWIVKNKNKDTSNFFFDIYSLGLDTPLSVIMSWYWLVPVLAIGQWCCFSFSLQKTRLWATTHSVPIRTTCWCTRWKRPWRWTRRTWSESSPWRGRALRRWRCICGRPWKVGQYLRAVGQIVPDKCLHLRVW